MRTSPLSGSKAFLSTPSARRATWAEWLKTSSRSNFYPRPPRGGRPITDTKLDELTRISIHALREEGDLRRCDLPPPDRPISIHALREEGDQDKIATLTAENQFLSTPSARRATARNVAVQRLIDISIHALREEGDRFRSGEVQFFLKFLSTPSARRATIQHG